jgi:DNA-binding transcriptional MerR regulator
MQIAFEKFTPGEAAEITGVSVENQRNLRRTGYLPSHKGHARFDIRDLAQLLVIGIMSERGIGPKVACTFAATAGQGVFLKAIARSTFYSIAAQRAALDDTKEEADESLALPEASDLDERTVRGMIARMHAADAAQAAAGLAGQEAPEFFCLWANGHPEFFYGEEHPFADCDYGHTAWQGPVIMLSMGALASLLVDRLPRPAILLQDEAAP